MFGRTHRNVSDRSCADELKISEPQALVVKLISKDMISVVMQIGEAEKHAQQPIE